MADTLLQRLALDRFDREVTWKEMAQEVANRLKTKPPLKNLLEYLRDFENRRTWWMKRREEGHALADYLGVDLADLGIAATARSGPHWVLFPGLPITLNLRDDDPCDLGFDDWNGIDGDLRWFECPHGAGRTLAARRLAARHREAVYLSVTRLRDIREAATSGGNVVLVDVDGPDPEHDGEAARALSMRGNVRVFATFSPPIVPDATEAISKTRAPAGWVHRKWAPRERDWRSRLVHWLRARIEGDTGLDAQPFVDAMDRFDPGFNLVATPGDVVELCAVAHEHGEAYVFRRNRRAVADRLVDDRIERAARADSAHAHWLRTRGTRAFVGIVEKLVARTDLGDRPLSMIDMASLLPGDLAPRPTPDTVRAALDRVVEPGNAIERRRRAADVARELAQPAADEAIMTLRHAGLLRGGPGGLDLHPPFAVLTIAEDEARRLIAQESASTWGHLRIQPGRRQLIDDALIGLSESDFVRVAHRCLESFNREDLCSVAAVEGVFLAASNRTRAPALPADRLATAQLSLLIERGGEAPNTPVPRTLPFSHETMNVWVAACWRFSSRYERPVGVDHHVAPWLFPFWEEPQLATAHDGWRPSLHPRADTEMDASAIADLLALAPGVLARCSDQPLPPDVPGILEHAVVLAAPGRGWQLDKIAKTWWQWIDQQQTAFLAVSQTLVRAEREAVALAMLSATGIADASMHLKRDHSLARWLWSNLPAGGLGSILTVENVKTLVATLDVLPADRWAEVASWAMTVDDPDLHRRVLIFGSDNRPWTLELATRWLDTSRARGESISWPASILMRLAPETVLREALTALDKKSSETETWFIAAARSGHAGALLQHIKDSLEEVQGDWLQRRLLELIDGGGETAVRAYGIWMRLRNEKQDIPDATAPPRRERAQPRPKARR